MIESATVAAAPITSLQNAPCARIQEQEQEEQGQHEHIQDTLIITRVAVLPLLCVAQGARPLGLLAAQ